MLAIAHQKRLSHRQASAQLIETDIFDYQTETSFGMILLPYNALMHFTDLPSQQKLLRHLASMLSGVIVIDLPNAGEAYSAEDELGIILERTFIEPHSGNRVMQQSVSHINRAEQRLYVQWIYDEIMPDGVLKRTLAPLVLRYIFPAEMSLLLASCGLESIAQYGDYDGSPFEDGCPRMIVIARLTT